MIAHSSETITATGIGFLAGCVFEPCMMVNELSSNLPEKPWRLFAHIKFFRQLSRLTPANEWCAKRLASVYKLSPI